MPTPFGHFSHPIRLALAVLVGAWPVALRAATSAATPPPPGFGEVLKIPGLPPIRIPPGTHVYEPGQDPARGGAPDAGNDRDFGTRVSPYGERGPGRAGDYGSTVIGPGGVLAPFPPPARRAEAPKKKVLTPEERAAAIRKALMPRPPLSVARRHTLDDLYTKLAAATDTDEAEGLATLIGNIWMRSSSDTANLLMQRAVESIRRKDYALAASLLDKIVDLQPDWAEGWNKRASVRFLTGDLDGSMADVEHVLKLEPKHFGALDGMAMILQRTGFDKQALAVYRRALAIYPHQPEIEKVVDKLSLEVEGQGI